jgi:hypothetical protein
MKTLENQKARATLLANLITNLQNVKIGKGGGYVSKIYDLVTNSLKNVGIIFLPLLLSSFLS